MAVERWRMVEGKSSTCYRHRAHESLECIIKPDQTVRVDADAGGMRAAENTGWRVEILFHSVVGARSGLRNVQHTNSAGPALRPPDVSFAINRNLMRGQAAATCGCGTYFVFLEHALSCIFPDQ